MSFQLAVLLKFPRDVFHLAAPMPLNLEEGPRITTEIGQIGFYFDDWDAPSGIEGAVLRLTSTPSSRTSCRRPPRREADRALTTDGHPYAAALHRWGSPEEEAAHAGSQWSIEEDETPDVSAERQWAEARLRELRRDHASHACDRLFADPALGRYLAPSEIA